MEYSTLGRTGLRVSELALGTMTFGEDWGWGASEDESKAILHEYISQGGNFIDTANGYTRGHSETIIGDFFSEHGGRDHVVLATKFFQGMFRGDPNGGGTGRKAILRQLHESLRRLKTDYIDLYWMHAWDSFTPVEETMRTLDDLVSAGTVRYIGFSDTPAWKTAQAQGLALWRGWEPLAAVQLQYSLRDRTVEGELIPMARELGLGVVPWGPLSDGVLTGKFTRANGAAVTSDRGPQVTAGITERDFTIIDALVKIAAEIGSEPAAVALAWLRQREGVTSPIVGVRRLDQLAANLASLTLHLSPEHVVTLDEVSVPILPFPIGFLASGMDLAYAGATINKRPSVAHDQFLVDSGVRY